LKYEPINQTFSFDHEECGCWIGALSASSFCGCLPFGGRRYAARTNAVQEMRIQWHPARINESKESVISETLPRVAFGGFAGRQAQALKNGSSVCQNETFMDALAQRVIR